tara:strand:- start:2644 stop:2835 length:192 start_codon:yes stop_codon:yes gene_type:complete
MVAVPTVALTKGDEKIVVTVGSNEEEVLKKRGFKEVGAKEVAPKEKAPKSIGEDSPKKGNTLV